MPDRFYSVGSITPGFLTRSRIPHGFYLVVYEIMIHLKNNIVNTFLCICDILLFMRYFAIDLFSVMRYNKTRKEVNLLERTLKKVKKIFRLNSTSIC